jgi:hypothetical protein
LFDLSFDNASKLEVECYAQRFSTNDQKEGVMMAFLEKRKRTVTGR